MRKGGCRCGAIRFVIAGEPLGGIACHCRDCQYAAGGSANLSWIYYLSGFTLEHGSPKVYRARPESGGAFFCSDCGVQVYSVPDRNPQLVAIKIGAFDNADGFQVQADIWLASAPDWHRPHEDALQFEGNMPSA